MVFEKKNRGILKSRNMHSPNKKAAIGILFAGFYTNWPRSLWVGARCEHPLERNSALGRKIA